MKMDGATLCNCHPDESHPKSGPFRSIRVDVPPVIDTVVWVWGEPYVVVSAEPDDGGGYKWSYTSFNGRTTLQPEAWKVKLFPATDEQVALDEAALQRHLESMKSRPWWKFW